MKTPTSIAAYRRWLTERFSELEALCERGDPDFFVQLDIAELIEEAKRLACRFGAGDLIGFEVPSATPRDGLAIVGRLLAWTEQEEPPELLSVEDVARKLGVSARSVWRMVSCGEISPPVKVGGLTKWRASEIQAMIDLLPRQER